MEYIDKTTNDGKIVKLKNYKRRAKINRIKRKLLLLLLLLIILVIILLFAPFMQIKTIKCIGNNQISPEEIIASSNISVGDNIIRISKKKAVKSINNISYIKSVEIDRDFPSTVNIKITECQIHAYVEYNKKYIYLDEAGKILEISNKLPEGKVPVITGIKIKNPIENEIIDFGNQTKLDSYKSVVTTLVSSRFKGMVTSIDIADTNKIMFKINDTINVILGDTKDIDYKINHKAAETYNSTEVTMTEMDLRYEDQVVIKSE